jgi:hypothetical protein
MQQKRKKIDAEDGKAAINPKFVDDDGKINDKE